MKKEIKTTYSVRHKKSGKFLNKCSFSKCLYISQCGKREPNLELLNYGGLCWSLGDFDEDYSFIGRTKKEFLDKLDSYIPHLMVYFNLNNKKYAVRQFEMTKEYEIVKISNYLTIEVTSA